MVLDRLGQHLAQLLGLCLEGLLRRGLEPVVLILEMCIRDSLKAILYDSGSIGVEETGVLNLENADRSYFNNQSACTCLLYTSRCV